LKSGWMFCRRLMATDMPGIVCQSVSGQSVSVQERFA